MMSPLLLAFAGNDSTHFNLVGQRRRTVQYAHVAITQSRKSEGKCGRRTFVSDRDIVNRCTRLWHEPILQRRGSHQRGQGASLISAAHSRDHRDCRSWQTAGKKLFSRCVRRVNEQSTHGRWRGKRNDAVLPRDRARERNVKADELVFLQRVGGVPGEKQPDVRLARCVGLDSQPEVAQVLPLCELQGQHAYFRAGYKKASSRRLTLSRYRCVRAFVSG